MLYINQFVVPSANGDRAAIPGRDRAAQPPRPHRDSMRGETHPDKNRPPHMADRQSRKDQISKKDRSKFKRRGSSTGRLAAVEYRCHSFYYYSDN